MELLANALLQSALCFLTNPPLERIKEPDLVFINLNCIAEALVSGRIV